MFTESNNSYTFITHKSSLRCFLISLQMVTYKGKLKSDLTDHFKETHQVQLDSFHVHEMNEIRKICTQCSVSL